MTERRQFCPRGHDTFVVGRDASYRCIRCKRDDGNKARDARKAEMAAARHAEFEARQAEEARQYQRVRARILKAGGPAARQFLWEEQFGERATFASGSLLTGSGVA
jgi:hypothetical protein